MSSGSIQIKRKDRNDGAGSTFDGIKFTFSPSIKVTQLTGLRVKRTRAAADDPGAISQNIFNDPSKFIFNGTSITLQIGRQEFIAVDFVREVSEEEFQAAATPEMIQFRNVLLSGIGSDLKGAAESEKMKNVISNMSSMNNSGEVRNGLQSLQSGAKPTLDFRNRPTVAQLLPGAGDGSADKVDSLKNELSSLFQKTNMKSSGNLNKSVFAMASTASFANILEKHTTMSKTKIKKETEKVLPSTISNKVLTTAREAIDDKSVGKTPSSNVVQSVRKEVAIKAKEINFAGFTTDAAGLIPGASRSGANALAHNFAKLKGIFSGVIDSVTSKVPGVPKGLKIPDGKNIPNLVEGVDEFTGKVSLDTNVRRFIPKGSLTSKIVKPVSSEKVTGSPTTFNGSNSERHEFKFVDTDDELFDELSSSSRLNSIKFDAISVLTVGYLGDDRYGPPDKMNAKKLHELKLVEDKQEIIRRNIESGKTPEEARRLADLTFKFQSAKFGIQSHYLCLTDGRIERGRPINEVRHPERDQYADIGLEFMFVAGPKNPVNPAQHESFEKFMRKIIKIVAGLNVYGDYEILEQSTGPGFDMGALREKLDIDYRIIENPADLENKDLDRKVLSIIQPPKNLIPKKVVTEQETKVNNTNPSKITKNFETVDPKTGEEIKQEVDAGIAQFEKVMSDINTGKIDIDTNINNAANQSFDAAKKGFADLNIKTGFEGFDNNTSQVDGFLSNVKANTTDLAKRIKQGLFK